MGSNNLNEDDILKRIIIGDEKAFKFLFDAYYDYAYSIAVLYCSKEEAEEVISDVFSNIWRNRERLNEISDFKNYLFKSIKNTCFNYLKRKRINFSSIENVFDHNFQTTTTPHEQLVTQELENQVYAVIESLPPKCLAAYKLVNEEGFQYKMAADRLSISENTLDAHLKKASRRIREVVKKYSMSILFMF